MLFYYDEHTYSSYEIENSLVGLNIISFLHVPLWEMILALSQPFFSSTQVENLQYYNIWTAF